MKKEEFENITNDILKKVGKENAGLIADSIGLLISDNAQMNEEINKRDDKINKLTQDKENLITTNGNLLQQITTGEKDNSNPFSQIKKEEEKRKPINFKSCFDKFGNFINE